jgi:DNA-binding NarL/FixJ family response regulator
VRVSERVLIVAMDRDCRGAFTMYSSLQGGSHRWCVDLEELSLLVVEDDQLIRESLLDWLDSVLPQWDLLGISSGEMVELAHGESPHTIVVDLTSPNGDRVDLVRRVTRQFPQADVVALTMRGDYATRRAVLKAGASASLPIWKLSEKLELVLRRLLEDMPQDRVEQGT